MKQYKLIKKETMKTLLKFILLIILLLLFIPTFSGSLTYIVQNNFLLGFTAGFKFELGTLIGIGIISAFVWAIHELIRSL